jgi:hypothetical protein
VILLRGEPDLQSHLIDYANKHGCWVKHWQQFKSPGHPDLDIVHHNVITYIECKDFSKIGLKTVQESKLFTDAQIPNFMKMTKAGIVVWLYGVYKGEVYVKALKESKDCYGMLPMTRDQMLSYCTIEQSLESSLLKTLALDKAYSML